MGCRVVGKGGDKSVQGSMNRSIVFQIFGSWSSIYTLGICSSVFLAWMGDDGIPAAYVDRWIQIRQRVSHKSQSHRIRAGPGFPGLVCATLSGKIRLNQDKRPVAIIPDQSYY